MEYISLLTDREGNSDRSHISIGSVDTDLHFDNDKISKAIEHITTNLEEISAGDQNIAAALLREYCCAMKILCQLPNILLQSP